MCIRDRTYYTWCFADLIISHSCHFRDIAYCLGNSSLSEVSSVAHELLILNLNWCTVCRVPIYKCPAKWRGEGSNPLPFNCESNILPLDSTRTKVEMSSWFVLFYLLIFESQVIWSPYLQFRFLWNHINDFWPGRKPQRTCQKPHLHIVYWTDILLTILDASLTWLSRSLVTWET